MATRSPLLDKLAAIDFRTSKGPAPAAAPAPAAVPPAAANPPVKADPPKPAARVLHSPPSIAPAPPAVQDAFPNRGKDPVAEYFTVSLFQTDIANATAIADYLRSIGHTNVFRSTAVQVALRYTQQHLGPQLSRHIAEITEEDGRRRRHKKGGGAAA